MNSTARKKTSSILIGSGLILLAISNWYPEVALHFGSWPITVALIGLLIGILSRFKHPLGYALLLIGAIFQATTELPLLSHWYLPILFICIGLLILFVTIRPFTLSNEKQ